MSEDKIEPQSGTSIGLKSRERLLAEIEEKRQQLNAVEASLGIDKVEWLDHIDGTNSEEWKCTVCGKVWWCPSKQPCPHCHPRLSNEKDEHRA